MSRSMASDLGLHFLPITLLGVSRLQWVNEENLAWKVRESNENNIHCGMVYMLYISK